VNTQFGSNHQASSLAYAAINTLIWVIYLALVLTITQVFALRSPMAEVIATLAAAILLYPLRRWATRAARQRFRHR